MVFVKQKTLQINKFKNTKGLKERFLKNMINDDMINMIKWV